MTDFGCWTWVARGDTHGEQRADTDEKGDTGEAASSTTSSNAIDYEIDELIREHQKQHVAARSSGDRRQVASISASSRGGLKT
jgi:hypothetical protein